VRLACIQLQLGRLGQDDARVLELLRAVHRIMGGAAAGAVLQRGASTLQAVAPGMRVACSCGPRDSIMMLAFSSFWVTRQWPLISGSTHQQQTSASIHGNPMNVAIWP
jgi:hypothetical protein